MLNLLDFNIYKYVLFSIIFLKSVCTFSWTGFCHQRIQSWSSISQCYCNKDCKEVIHLNEFISMGPWYITIGILINKGTGELILFSLHHVRTQQKGGKTETGSFSSVQSLSRVRLFATPRTAACQASLSIMNSQSLLKLLSKILTKQYPGSLPEPSHAGVLVSDFQTPEMSENKFPLFKPPGLW